MVPVLHGVTCDIACKHCTRYSMNVCWKNLHTLSGYFNNASILYLRVQTVLFFFFEKNRAWSCTKKARYAMVFQRLFQVLVTAFVLLQHTKYLAFPYSSAYSVRTPDKYWPWLNRMKKTHDQKITFSRGGMGEYAQTQIRVCNIWDSFFFI